jgi:hypothetical protein
MKIQKSAPATPQRTGENARGSRNFQRIGSESNAQVGRHFEALAQEWLKEAGITVSNDFTVQVGISNAKKAHRFDLGADDPPTIVECKSHRWTRGNNVPSAKMTVWNEAMYYFACAPRDYRKIFFVLRDVRSSNGETLSQYYIRTYRHLIPPGVEIWEYDVDSQSAEIVLPGN